MAISTPSYVEPWDAAEFPFHLERSGLVRYHQRVVITSDDIVLEGHEAVASAIVESWCADNPGLVSALIDEWIEKAAVADRSDKDWMRRWEDRLNYNPQLAAALQRKDWQAEVFKRAELTPFQQRAVELMLDGKTNTEIGVRFGISRQSAQDRIDAALEKILALDRESDLSD